MTTPTPFANPAPLPPETARAVLDRLAPGSTFLGVRPFAGSFSNYTHLIEARGPAGAPVRLVVRRYAAPGGAAEARARREYGTLQVLQERGVPAPVPLFLDDSGTLLGRPGIVTALVPGRQRLQPADPRRWAVRLARQLVRIHTIAGSAPPVPELLDADEETVWFLRGGQVPAFMAAHPDGPAVWEAVHELWPARIRVPSALVHLDYWTGNVLWQGNRITAVLDWEEAAWGDPGTDVGYAYLDLWTLGVPEAAAVFLASYEAASGRPVANLALWGLAAAARPMPDPARVLPERAALGGVPVSADEARARLRTFVAAMLRRVASGARSPEAG